jgi:hypothetical protein
MIVERPRLFLDSDGVLLDFDAKFMELSGGLSSSEYEDTYGAKQFWKLIREHDDFFYNLPFMKGGWELWSHCQQYDPTILTGAPFGNWAAPQKIRAAKDRFNTDKIIVCLSRNKRDHANPGDVLVDDLLKYKHLWEEMGGVFVHHTSFDTTVAALKEIYHGKDYSSTNV